MTYPIPNVDVSTPYGKRGPYWSCNANSSGGVHTGVDFACSQGTDIYAPIAGQIRHRSYGSAFGGHQFAISPDDDEPFGDGEVFFAHTTDRLADGVRVDVGDYVASVGAEGNVSGPHLHMEYHPDTKGVWSCSVHADPAPILEHGGGSSATNPTNPNGVAVGDTALVTASGALNGRSHAAPDAEVVTTRPYGSELVCEALEAGWALSGDAWFSTDYLFPKVKPDPTNPNGVAAGDDVTVTASALTARTLPGGPPRLEDGETLTRPEGYEFDIKEMSGGWASGGTNWYSSDYLTVSVAATKPGWESSPRVVLPLDDAPGSVSYLQAGVRVAANGGEPDVWIVAQDYENDGNTRFGRWTATGVLIDGMTVTNGGHGQTFHAYRSAAGNLYVWTLIGDYAYRIKWAPGRTVTTSSDGVEKMAYGTARPVGSYEPFIGFRSATDTKETLSIHNRFGFTDPENNSADPIHKVTINKRTDHTQQSWAVSEDRIYRIYGKTNETPGSSSGKHVIDVLDWSGKLLVDRMDISDMYRSGCDENEPEGLTFTGAPGAVLAGMREGPAKAAHRDYVWWTLTGLP